MQKEMEQMKLRLEKLEEENAAGGDRPEAPGVRVAS